VQSATFNGETLDRTWLTARELHRGGHLRIELGPHQTGWAAATRPPSVSKSATNFRTAATADPTPASAVE
jgi:putative alpha-1,2-mannosidase